MVHNAYKTVNDNISPNSLGMAPVILFSFIKLIEYNVNWNYRKVESLVVYIDINVDIWAISLGREPVKLFVSKFLWQAKVNKTHIIIVRNNYRYLQVFQRRW